MREFRFRAWDSNYNRMVYPSKKYSDGGIISCFEDEDIMQHTGLRDINGNPIYEKDLLRIGKYKTLVQVVYRDGAFQTEGPGDHDHEIHRPLHYFVSNQIKMEVVGNIYQDPDLFLIH